MKHTIFARVAGWFYTRMRFSLVLFVLLIGFGMVAYTTLMRREGFPSVQVPIAVVSGVYPVNDTERVDVEAALPVAQIVSGVEGVVAVRTTSDANFFSVVAELDDDTNNIDASAAIQAAIEASDSTPERLSLEYPSIDAAKFFGEYDILVSVYGDDLGAAELEKLAASFVTDFTNLASVSRATVEPLIRNGQDPQTGTAIATQSSFGAVGIRTNELVEFYPAITIGITGLSGEELDIFTLSKEVNERVDAINAARTESGRLVVSADFTESINNQIQSLESNVLGGIIAITLISALMIGWRVSLVTAFFMVAVMAVTILILFALGYTLNTITLFGLVLSLGLFVDDATIISESIDAERSRKKKPKAMLQRAIDRVGSASLAGSLTTILVFVPLLFIGGVLGEFIFLLPMTVIVALLVSYVLSITLIPFLSRFTLLSGSSLRSAHVRHNPIPDGLARMISLLRTRRTLGILVGAGMVTLSVVSIITAGYFAGKLSFNIFPQSKDSDELLLTITYKSGTDMVQAQRIAKEAGQIAALTLNDNLERVVFGRGGAPNSRSADALLELTPFTERDAKSPNLIRQLESAFADFDLAKVQVQQLDAGPPIEEFPFKMQISGSDQLVIRAAAESIAQELSGKTLTRANGTTATVTTTEVSSSDVISRLNNQQQVQVFAAFDADDTSSLVQVTQDLVEETYSSQRLIELGLEADALGFDFGQESENEESFSTLGPAGMAALLAMFVLLALQFRSVLKPLLIFMALPFSLLGVTWGLYISQNPLSFFVMVGFIGLIGIAVNNTILLTDYANQELREGKSPIDAIARAAQKRFRPLFTTTATTIAALAPLAMSDPFWEPLALTIMFGLLSSTILVILAFPYYYLAEEVVARFFKRLYRSVRAMVGRV